MSSESNGSASPDLSKPHPGLRDHTEDELDAEMPEVPATNSEAASASNTLPQASHQSINPEIEDEMVNETSEAAEEAVGE